MKNTSLKLLIIFSMFSAACSLPPGSSVSYGCVTGEPSRSEVAGTYVADERTLKMMEVRGRYNPATVPKLILHEDGTLDAVNLPDWWSSLSQPNGNFEPPSSGTWQFYSFQGDCAELGLHLSSSEAYVKFLKNRFGQAPRYVISRYIGDPDAGNWMVFVKE